MAPNKKPVMRFTRQQQQVLKKKGNVRGYFSAPALGRPKKAKNLSDVIVKDPMTSGSPSIKATPASYRMPSPPINGTAKGTHTNWNTEQNFPILHEAVIAFLNHGDNANPLTVAMVPHQTL
jgi:hypothetical protein